MLSLNDLCETNELFQRSTKSTKETRYERKAREQATKTAVTGDRFIPSRDAMNHDMSVHKQGQQGDKENTGNSSANEAFNNKLAQSLFHGDGKHSFIVCIANIWTGARMVYTITHTRTQI